MIIAGLTGGIASGKSTVSRILSDAGAHVIDADQIAKEEVEKGTPAYRDIVSFFGRGILQTDGAIDRKRLADIIFNDPEKKARLNAIVHPHVHRRTQQKIADISRRTSDAVVILDIPLLLEAGMDRNLDELIVVYAPESIQLERLMQRDAIDAAAAMARIRSQMPIDEKRRRATIVIDNSGSLDDCRRQALEVFERLNSGAGSRRD